MNHPPDWHEELYQLLIGHLEGSFDEGVRELAHYHRELERKGARR